MIWKDILDSPSHTRMHTYAHTYAHEWGGRCWRTTFLLCREDAKIPNAFLMPAGHKPNRERRKTHSHVMALIQSNFSLLFHPWCPNRVKKPAPQLFCWKFNKCLNSLHLLLPPWTLSKSNFKLLMLSSWYNWTFVVNFRNRLDYL